MIQLQCANGLVRVAPHQGESRGLHPAFPRALPFTRDEEKRMTMNDPTFESGFRNFIQNDPDLIRILALRENRGLRRPALHQFEVETMLLNDCLSQTHTESPIETLLFRGFASQMLRLAPLGFLYFGKTENVIESIEWLKGINSDPNLFSVDRLFAARAEVFEWHIYLQAGFPDLRRRVDAFAWCHDGRKSPVVIECDGFDFHSNKKDMAKDRERDRLFTSRGYRVVRFTGTEIFTKPMKCCEDLAKVLFPEFFDA